MNTADDSPANDTNLPTPKTSAISWGDWGDDAFRAADTGGKPVLLALTATWCHWCHVMDQTSYSDPRVIEMVNRWFVPIRVDVDQRPDLSARYNQGGFPSLALLDSDGQVIAGRVYMPPDEMIKLLEEVRTAHSEGKPLASTNSVPPSSSPSQVEGATQDIVLQRLDELYDTGFGGFGAEPKQPPFESIQFLLSLYQRNGEAKLQEMASHTLNGILEGLYDNRDGGFFRYSVSRDWRVPHFEKMLYTNARLASNFLLGFQVTGKGAYRNAVLGTFSYLMTKLRDPSSGMFWASEDAEEDYYRLPWKDRDTAKKPSIDTTIYTGWNAAAATALIQAYGVLGEASYLEQALLVLGTLWDEFDRDRELPHIVSDPVGRPRFLSDHIHAFSAFLNCYQATGSKVHLERAGLILVSMTQQFIAPDGGFYDVASREVSGGPKLVGVRPVLENAILAESLVTLANITQDETYMEMANATLQYFTEVVPASSYLGPPNLRIVEEDEERLFAPAASAWARAMDIVESGTVDLVVVGDTSLKATKGLVKASLQARTHSWVVQVLDPVNDAVAVKRLGFPVNVAPAVYLCVGRQCLAPIHSPRELRKWARPGALAAMIASQNQ
jgi:uncharacterized protein YyaL (SSP411 family)